ncbi:MAG: AraC family transcriptional regulator [Sphingomonas sp.]
MSIVDLEEEPTARLESPFDALHFYVPRAALDAIADQRGAKRIGTLRCARGTLDETVWHLGRALLPALERPAEVSAIYADQALLATHLYFATAFGGMRAATPVRAGCLAPWQLRRATEIMLDDLGADLPLSTLAAACRLSSTHFARAFRQTVGEPPHRWLVRQRIERAKLLMRDTRSTLAEIALACGFADQSHFTRSFGAAVGATPRTWRRGIH